MTGASPSMQEGGLEGSADTGAAHLTPHPLVAMQNLARTPAIAQYPGMLAPPSAGAFVSPIQASTVTTGPPPVAQYYFSSATTPLTAVAAAALGSPARRPGGRPRSAATASSSKRHCNCKNSRCLKLYCECFASGRYCDGCNCIGCCNNQAHEGVRQAAVEAILDRNPNAFRPKIAGDVSEEGSAIGAVRHNKGCNCKKSGCLKKYCECFQAGIFCSANCKCVDCKNFEGSEARAAAISPGVPAHLLGPAHDAAGRDPAALGSPGAAPRAAVGQPTLRAANPLYLASSPPLGADGAYRPHGVGSPGQLHQGLPVPPLFVPSLAGALLPPSPASQGPALHVPRAQRAAALREALKEVVKPEVVEKVCQLLLISAGEAQAAHSTAAEADGPADAGVERGAPSFMDFLTAGPDVAMESDPAGAGGWRPDTLYADQERRVLLEFRDGLQMLSGLVQGKSERKLRDAMTNGALVAMLSHAAAASGLQQFRTTHPSMRAPLGYGHGGASASGEPQPSTSSPRGAGPSAGPSPGT